VTKHTYLFKSRHGVYYFRAVIPRHLRPAHNLRCRERRVSLRTKDKTKAKLLVAKKTLQMHQDFSQHLPWEVDAERRDERYALGCRLIEEWGEDYDLDDEFKLNAFLEAHGHEALEAYLFARTYRAERKAALAAQQQPVSQRHAAAAAPEPSGGAATPSAAEEDETLDGALQRFIAHKQRATDAATAAKYKSQCRLFIKIVSEGRDGGNKLHLSDLTPKDLKHYLDTLLKLPRKTSPDDARPISVILAGPHHPMSPKTLFAHGQAVNMFLSWCAEQQYRVPKGFDSILKPILSKPKASKTKIRKHFTNDELQRLFGSEPYMTGSFARASDYWIPLLGLFTGAREAELCQLSTADIRMDQTSSLWTININDSGDDKKLKTSSSNREIPVHPQLIALGFIAYANATAARKQERLFPDERRNERGEFGAFSKRFNRYKEALGIKSNPYQKLDFHSFRHTLQTVLFDLGVEEYLINSICGHGEAGRSVGYRVYSKGPGLDAKNTALLELHYDIDFTAIRANGWTGALDLLGADAGDPT
jgi:integrase